MHRKRLIVVSLAGAIVLAAATGLAADDLTSATFAKRAAAAGMAEVELGKMAESKAENAAVKAFAQTMVRDHGAANGELERLASKNKIALPTAIEPDARAVADKLKSLSGAAFDRAYMEQMVLDHGGAVFLFATASKSAKVDGDLQAFATKTLPTLKHHMKEAQQITRQLPAAAKH